MKVAADVMSEHAAVDGSDGHPNMEFALQITDWCMWHIVDCSHGGAKAFASVDKVRAVHVQSCHQGGIDVPK